MIVAIDEIPRAAEPCDPALDWRPVRDHLGISAFGVNAFVGAAAGDRLIEAHDEDAAGHEELYVVLRGAARFVIDGEEHDVPAGSLVLVAPASHREAFATQPGSAVLVVGATPGTPFAVSEWEARQLALSGRAPRG
jgi:quercetin dioxygenase-like cupin family protein